MNLETVKTALKDLFDAALHCAAAMDWSPADQMAEEMQQLRAEVEALKAEPECRERKAA